MRRSGLRSFCAAALALCACHKQAAVPPAAGGGDVAAQIDDTVITVKDVQDRLHAMSPYMQVRYTSPERKKEFLDNMVRFEVLASEAKRLGYDKDPEVLQEMKETMVRKLVKNELESQVKLSDVADADIEKYYQDHLADYNTPEKRRCMAVVVSDPKLASTVAGMAKALKPEDNAGFRKLVDTYSQDVATKPRGGDLQYFRADAPDVPPEVRAASFAMQKFGDVAGPVQTGKGYYILRYLAKRDAASHTLVEVKEQIRMRLFRDLRNKAMDAWVDKLRSAANVKVFPDKLSEVQVEVPSGMNPGGAIPPGAQVLGGAAMPPAPIAPPVARPGVGFVPSAATLAPPGARRPAPMPIVPNPTPGRPPQ